MRFHGLLWLVWVGAFASSPRAEESPVEGAPEASTPDAARAAAQLVAEAGDVAEAEAARADATDFFALPAAFYSQETSVGFTVFANYVFPLAAAGPQTWPSTLRAAAVYTLENQASLTFWPSFYWGPHNQWGFTGQYTLSHFPDHFFGIGNDTSGEYQAYTERQARLTSRLRRRAVGDLYVGGIHELVLTDVWEIGGMYDADGDALPDATPDLLDPATVPGGRASRIHGVGLGLALDTRDSDQASREGALASLEWTGYPAFLGSDHSFSATRLDLRGFIPLFERHTLALQGLLEVREGAVPFTAQHELGGDFVLRGLYQGRFRDYNALVFQVEYRAPVVWRLGVVAFAGVGEVFRRFADIDAAGLTWTAGGGLRVAIDDDARTNVRLDVGGGPDGFGFILTFGEAF